MLIMNRAWAMSSAWTFTIPPIRELLSRYVGDGRNWADPFAGMNSPAEWRNDLNPEAKAEYHLEAADFAAVCPVGLAGVLFDPPYSFRQISEHYKTIGKEASRLDTTSNFYARVINGFAPKIAEGGYAVSFGWNSAGFGKKRGFEQVEILLVAHGAHKNDTIVTVERKIQLSDHGLFRELR